MNRFKFVIIVVAIIIFGGVIKFIGYEKVILTKEDSMKLVLDINVYGREEEREKLRMPKSRVYLNNKSRIGTFKHNLLNYIGANEDEVDSEILERFLGLVFQKVDTGKIKIGESKEVNNLEEFDIYIKPFNIKEVIQKSINTVTYDKKYKNREEYNSEILKQAIENIDLLVESDEYVNLKIKLERKNNFYNYYDIEEVMMISSVLLSFK